MFVLLLQLQMVQMTHLTLQWCWGLISIYCPRFRAFKFVVPFNAFTTIHCSETGIGRLIITVHDWREFSSLKYSYYMLELVDWCIIPCIIKGCIWCGALWQCIDFYRGFLYFKNYMVLWCTNKCSNIYGHKKSTAFPVPICKTHKCWTEFSYTSTRLNCTVNVESTR
jgi:hypothetical protein